MATRILKQYYQQDTLIVFIYGRIPGEVFTDVKVKPELEKTVRGASQCSQVLPEKKLITRFYLPLTLR